MEILSALPNLSQIALHDFHFSRQSRRLKLGDGLLKVSQRRCQVDTIAAEQAPGDLCTRDLYQDLA